VPRSIPTPPAARPTRRRHRPDASARRPVPARRTWIAPLALGALGILAIGCGRGAETTSTGGGTTGTTSAVASGVTGTGTSTPTTAVGAPGTPLESGTVEPAPAGPGASTGPGGPGLPATPGGPTTTCVRGPATTTPFGGGGGEITCSTIPPDGSVSSPPLTDTTIPTAPGEALIPDAGHGVLRGSVGGAPCPATAEQCVASYRFVPALVAARGPVSSTARTDALGQYQLLLPPGRYEVVASPDGDDLCTPGVAEVVAGQTLDVSIDCRPRG